MKLLSNFRLFLVFTLGLCISVPPVFSQDDKEEETDKKEQTDQQPQRGKGGQRGGQGGGGQGGGLPDMSEMTKEERMARLNEIIQKNVVQMVEAVEPREDQQEAFVKTQAGFEVEMIKIQGQMRSVGRDRQKRQGLMQAMNKNSSNTNKAMKKILDKDQMKIYSAKLKERMPQQRRGGKGR